MTRQLWCRGTDMACAKSIVIRWSRIWIQRNILNYIWITGKTVSEMTPLPLFVVRYGIIHIYTRYNLALKAAASLKSEMCTLWFENACQSGLSEAKSNETFRDRDVFVVHFAVVVFRPRYANYLLYSTCLLINTRWYIEYKTIDVITYPYPHSSRKKIPSYVHGRCLVISCNFVPVNSIHMLYHFLRLWSRSGKSSYHLITRNLDTARYGQGSRQQCCWCTCKISRRCGSLNSRSRDFDTSRDLVTKRLSAW